MGVDYTGHYGIGVELEPIDFEDENLSKETRDLECMTEVLEEKLDSERFSWFETGQGNYTGQENDYYVEIIQPFADGIGGLQAKADGLMEHLKELGLKTKGDFGLIGGLEIY